MGIVTAIEKAETKFSKHSIKLGRRTVQCVYSNFTLQKWV